MRLVRFNFESPRMAEAMLNLGLIPEEIKPRKTRNDFLSEDERITEL